MRANILHVSREICVLTVFLLLSFVFYLYAVENSSNGINFFSVLYISIVSFYIFKLRGGWLLFLYFFSFVFTVISGALAEYFDAYMFEVASNAELTGAAARNSLLACIFILISYMFFRVFCEFGQAKIASVRFYDNLIHRIITVLAYVALLYLICVLFVYGSPVVIGVDRFVYSSSVAPDSYNFVYAITPLLGLVVSLARFKNILSGFSAALWLFVAFGVYIFAGEKFSKFILLIFFFFLPAFLLNGTVRLKHAVLIGAFVFLLSTLVLINYYLIYGSVAIFIPRLAVQGQMPYALDSLVEGLKEMEVIFNSLLGFSGGQVDKGIAYLMYLIAPSDIVDLRLANGATFTAPFPMNFAYYFGRLGAIPALALIAVLLGWIMSVLYRSIQDKCFLLAMISAKAFLMFYYSVVMGNLDVLLSVNGFLHVFVIITYLLISRFFIRRY